MRLASLLSTFLKFFMSLFLWGDAVAVLLALALCLLPPLAEGPYKAKHNNKVQPHVLCSKNLWAAYIDRWPEAVPMCTVWSLTPARRTFWMFWGPGLPPWPVEGVRCRAVAFWADLGGFLGRWWDWFVIVKASFFLETAPLPVTTNTCSYINRNITLESLWSPPYAAHRSPRIPS